MQENDSKSDFKPLSDSQLDNINIPSNQEKGLNEQKFKTLKDIPEDEQIEIIQRGFQLQAEDKIKISLKDYYQNQSTEEYSLFQFKKYCTSYESIRKSKLYQELKAKTN